MAIDGSTSDSDNESLSSEAEFDFFDPSERHYHGIRQLLVDYTLLGLTSDGGSGKTKKRRRCNESGAPEAPPPAPKRPLPSRLADCICEQGNIGVVVCVGGTEPNLDRPNCASDSTAADIVPATAENDREVLGFATILNPFQYSATDQGVAELNAAILSEARKRLLPKHYEKLAQLLEPQAGGSTARCDNRDYCKRERKQILNTLETPVPGLLVSDRVGNLPHDVVPQIFENLMEDVSWSQTTPECPEDERPYYSFTHLVGISSCFVVPTQKSQTPAEESSRIQEAATEEVIDSVKSKAKPAIPLESGSIRFPKFEDEFFVKYSDFHFIIPINYKSRIPNPSDNSERTRRSTTIEVQQCRLVFVLPYSKLRRVIRRCTRLVSDSDKL